MLCGMIYRQAEKASTVHSMTLRKRNQEEEASVLLIHPHPIPTTLLCTEREQEILHAEKCIFTL